MYTRRKFITTSVVSATSLAAVSGCLSEDGPLVEIFPCADHFERRANSLTVNICGALSKRVDSAQYSINGSSWELLPQGEPRVPQPLFNIELQSDSLKEGENLLEIEAKSDQKIREKFSKRFTYSSAPIQLPSTVSWSEKSNLDVQDGYWETVQVEDEWRVRPKPEFEEYDRILNVTGAFSGGRRVEVDLIFRNPGWLGWRGKRDYGFGILNLWGGHIEDTKIRPRRGWSYGLAWIYVPRRMPNQKEEAGLTVEFGRKVGDEKHKRSFSIEALAPQTDLRYSVIAEAAPVHSSTGQFQHWQQRLKWWEAGKQEPENWLVMGDTEVQPPLLPEEEYAVSLLAHRTQVEFGNVSVTRLQPISSKA